MIDIKKYLEETNTVLLTKEAFEYLKERACVLDKIRAEIANLYDADYDYEGYYKAITDAVKIIDKYKAESNSQESEEI